MASLRKLEQETAAAVLLLAQSKDVYAGDEEFAHDLVEGQTNLNEVMQLVLEAYLLDVAYIQGIDETIKKLQARKDRLDRRTKVTRSAIATAMDVAGVKELPTPIGKVTVVPVAPGLIVLTEASIPSRFWKKPEPVLDKKALLQALKEKEAIPGATLSNGSKTIRISSS